MPGRGAGGRGSGTAGPGGTSRSRSSSRGPRGGAPTSAAGSAGNSLSSFLRLAHSVAREVAAHQERADRVFAQAEEGVAALRSGQSSGAPPLGQSLGSASAAAFKFSVASNGAAHELSASLVAIGADARFDVDDHAHLQKLELPEWTPLRPRCAQDSQPPQLTASDTAPSDESLTHAPPASQQPRVDGTSLSELDHTSSPSLAATSPPAPASLPLTMANPPPAAAPVLREFPALDRAFAKRVVASVDTPEMYPALARALAMRQQRLGLAPRDEWLSQPQPTAPAPVPVPSATQPTEKEGAALPNHATPSSSRRPSEASASALNGPPVTLPEPVAAASTTPSSGASSRRSSCDSASSAPPIDEPEPCPPALLPLAPEEAEARDVKLLLKQQALQIICEQVQTRIRQLTRQRFFHTWRRCWKLNRFSTVLTRSIVRLSLHTWRHAARFETRHRTAAAISIQSFVRGRQALARYPALQAAVHLNRRSIVAHAWTRWRARCALILRWRRRWASKLAWGVRSVHLTGTPFPARRWRAEEGTMVMAEQYCAWRRKCTLWAKWIKFLAQQGTSQEDAAHAPAAAAESHVRWS